MRSETKWTRTEDEKPPMGAVVDWITPNGEQVNGGKYNRMWFLPSDWAMYAYYTPTYWRLSALAAVKGEGE